MAGQQRGRKPDPAVDAAIREAVIDLLFEHGFAVTFDDVAARAGVGRASVFRRFPTKRDMILSAIGQLSIERVEAPDTGSLRGDLVALIASIMTVFGDPSTRVLARRFHGEACRDNAFTDLLRANLDRRLALITSVLARGTERGELAPTADTRLIADLISGLVALHLATDTPLPDDTKIVRLVDGFLHGFARPAGPAH